MSFHGMLLFSKSILWKAKELATVSFFLHLRMSFRVKINDHLFKNVLQGLQKQGHVSHSLKLIFFHGFLFLFFIIF